MSRFYSKIMRLGVGLLIVSLNTSLLTACQKSSEPTGQAPVRSSGKAAIGGAYTLVDQTGKTVTQADYLGKPQLIYFGFGYCPDVCPTALQQMGAAVDIAKASDDIQSIFITVDPKRDTPERLAQFVTANGFPKGLIGLTGTPEQIQQAEKVFGVYAQKVDDPSSAAGYTFDHTSIIYLMDKNGEFVDVFTHGSTPAEIAKRVRLLLKTGQ